MDKTDKYLLKVDKELREALIEYKKYKKLDICGRCGTKRIHEPSISISDTEYYVKISCKSDTPFGYQWIVSWGSMRYDYDEDDEDDSHSYFESREFDSESFITLDQALNSAKCLIQKLKIKI